MTPVVKTLCEIRARGTPPVAIAGNAALGKGSLVYFVDFGAIFNQFFSQLHMFLLLLLNFFDSLDF